MGVIIEHDVEISEFLDAGLDGDADNAGDVSRE